MTHRLKPEAARPVVLRRAAATVGSERVEARKSSPAKWKKEDDTKSVGKTEVGGKIWWDKDRVVVEMWVDDLTA